MMTSNWNTYHAIQKKRKHEVLTEDTVQDKPAPEAKASGPGIDPECWEMFIITSGEKVTSLEAEIAGLGLWIAPIVKINLSLAKTGLADVEGLWFDPETGECNRDDEKFLASLSAVKKIFNIRVAEIEKLVKAATRSRKWDFRASHQSLARASTNVRTYKAKDKAGSNT